MSFQRKLKRDKAKRDAAATATRARQEDAVDLAALGHARAADYVHAVTLDDEGRTVFAGAADGSVVAMDAASGEVRWTARVHEGATKSLAILGDRLVSGGEDGRVALLDLATGLALREPVAAPKPAAWVEAVVPAPLSSLVAVACGRRVRLFDAGTGVVIAETDPLPSTAISPRFSPEGDRLYVGADGGISVFDPAKGGAPVDTLAYKGAPLCVDVSADGRWVAAGFIDRSVHVFGPGAGPGKRANWTMTGYPEKPRAVAFNALTTHLFTAAACDVVVWDLARLDDDAGSVLAGHEGRVTTLAARPGSALVASGGADGRLCLFRAGRDRALCRFRGGAGGVSALAWSASGTRLAAGTGDGDVEAFAVIRAGEGR